MCVCQKYLKDPSTYATSFNDYPIIDTAKSTAFNNWYKRPLINCQYPNAFVHHGISNYVCHKDEYWFPTKKGLLIDENRKIF